MKISNKQKWTNSEKKTTRRHRCCRCNRLFKAVDSRPTELELNEISFDTVGNSLKFPWTTNYIYNLAK